MECCDGKSEEDFEVNPAVLEIASKMPYPEIHLADTYRYTEYEFYTTLRGLMESCRYTEFSWRDLNAPTSKRLRVQLSAVINLVKYLKGEQLKVYAELNEPVSTRAFVRKSPCTDRALTVCFDLSDNLFAAF
jgi:hypothetical protein